MVQLRKIFHKGNDHRAGADLDYADFQLQSATIG